jgi:protein TonB
MFIASCTSVIAHALWLLWLMYRPSVVVAEPLPQAAIMLQSAAVPQAQNIEHHDVARDLKASQAAQAQHEVQKHALPGKPLPQHDMAKIALPKRRVQPDRPRPQKKMAKDLPAPQQSQPALEKNMAQVQAISAKQTAAQQSTEGDVATSQARITWASRLMAHLEKFKRYPGRETGTATVRFSLDDAGNVLSYQLVKSSGSATLDQAVLDMVKRASPVPPPPPGVHKTITAPVNFTLK